MQARVFMFIIALLGVFWSGMLVAGRAGAQAVPVLSIEQQLANQRALINQLQARLSALEGRGGVGSAKPAGTPVAPPRVVRLKSSVGDMTPGLTQLQMRHAQFARTGRRDGRARSGRRVASREPHERGRGAEVAALGRRNVDLRRAGAGAQQRQRRRQRHEHHVYRRRAGRVVGLRRLRASAGFAGWTPLYGNPPAPCFAAGY